jgi:membrane protease YdiL (CAAX protease family)
MAKSRFSLIAHPWLFLLIFIVATIICQILIGVILVVVFKLQQSTQIFGAWVELFGNLLLLFFVVPFIFGFPKRSKPYETYLDEIRLTHIKPLLKLLLLGISCYVIIALCQVVGVLVYRVMHHLPIDISFMRYAFVITNELPPHSSSWFYSFPSVTEEIAFRGVVLFMFLRFYKQPKAILFSALGFGAIHLGNLLYGGNPTWVVSMALWAAILGLFYGYVTIKSDSLIPAMLVHYLGNLFVSALNAYIQNNATLLEQSIYGIIFTMGVVPVILMILWVRGYTSWMKITTSI